MTKKRDPAEKRITLVRGDFIDTRFGFFEVLGSAGDLVIVQPRSREWHSFKAGWREIFRRLVKLGSTQ